MNTAFKKMTRAIAWLATASLTLGFAMMPTGAAAATVYKYEWVAQSGTVSPDGYAHQYTGLHAGDTIDMSLTLINRSGTTILGKSALPAGTLQVPIGTWGVGTQNPQDGTPAFLDASSFVLNNNRFVYYDGAAVANGAQFTMTWKVKLAATVSNATYDLYYRPVCEYKAWTRQVKNGYTLAGTNSDIFTRFVVGSGVSTAPTGGLSIATSYGTPAAGNVPNGGSTLFTKVTLTPAAGATVAITSIYVTRSGLSADAALENIRIIRASDNVQMGNTAGGFNADHKAQVFFSPALTIASATDFYLKAGIVTSTVTAPAGNTAALGIVSNSDIMSNATSITGAPVAGNLMTFVNVTLGTLTLAEWGSVADQKPDAGAKGVTLDTFQLQAGTEDMTVEQITTLKAGTAAVTDTANITLVNDTTGVTVAVVPSWNAESKAVFNFSPALVIAKGTTVRFSIKIDIVSGSGLTVNCDVSDGSMGLVVAKGGTYGFYVEPTYVSGTWNGTGDASQNIAAGSLTVSKATNTAPTGNITIADAQVLGTWAFDARGEDVLITALSVDLSGSITEADDESNVSLFDETGKIVCGPIDSSSDGAVVLNRELDFTQSFIVPVGVHFYTLKARIDDTAGGTETITATITANGDITARTIRTNTALVASTTILGAPAALNAMTVQSAALVSTTLLTPVAKSIVPGISNFVWMTGSFDAGNSGEDMRVTAAQFSLVTGSTADVDDLANMTIWADKDTTSSPRGDVFETQLSLPKQNSGNGAGDDVDVAITFDKVALTIPKGTSVKIAFVADLSASVLVGGGSKSYTIAFDTDTSDITAVGLSSGTAVTTAPTGAGVAMTVIANGVVTITSDSSAPLAKLVSGNSSKVLAHIWRFTTSSIEAVEIDDIKVTSSGTALDDISKVYLYADRNGSGAKVTPFEIASGNQGTAATTYYVTDGKTLIPADSYVLVYIYVDTSSVDGTSVANGDTIKFDLADVSADVNVTGKSSGQQFDPAGTDDRVSAAHQLYKTYPTVTVAPTSPSGNLVIGSLQKVAIFRITADAGDDVTFDDGTKSTLIVNFLPFATDLTGANITSEVWNDTEGVKIASPAVVTWAGTPFTTDSAITYTFEDNGTDSLTIPAGGYKDIAVKIDTTTFEDGGDAITAYIDDTAANFAWGIAGVGTYATGDISFRGELRAHSLVKSS